MDPETTIETSAPTPATTQEGEKPKKRKVNYLNNKDLLEQVKRSKAQGRMTDELAKMLMLLCARYASKGSYVNYSYREDMESFATLMLVKTWASFDETRFFNPFAFYTQCVKNSFSQFLNTEKRHRDIRDGLMVDAGMNPSFGYSEDGATPGDSYED